jgi:uncharacterized protein YkwD
MPRRRLALAALYLTFGTGCSDDAGGTTDDPGTTSAADTGDPPPDVTEGTDPTAEPTSGSGGDADSAVWDTPYCFGVAGAMKWPEPLPSWELEVLELVNAARAVGGDCGSMGQLGPSAPLKMNASLHCAARVHSKDMADRNYFDHVNPEGESPFVRIDRAGYGGYAAAGENIAAGTDTPEATVMGWLASDGHCANMLSPEYTEIGVGAYEGPGDYVYYWTQTFARPL